MNEEFKQNVIQIAEEFDLDEIESAKLLLRALANAAGSQRNPLVTCIINYHEQRQYILDCWRLILKEAIDPELHTEASAVLKDVVNHVLGTRNNDATSSSCYWRKCITAMKAIEIWLDHLSNRIQSLSVIGQGTSDELAEILYFQRSSLYRQHESATAVVFYLVKAGCSTIDDFLWLLSSAKSLEKHDSILFRYYLIILSLINYHGSVEGSCSMHDVKTLHAAIIGNREVNGWAQRSFHAAVIASWISEYSGRVADMTDGQNVNESDNGSDLESYESIFLESLKDGAFQFILSIVQDVKPNDWYDPVKEALSSLLLEDSSRLPSDSVSHAEFSQICLMEQTQRFIENMIANMPDTLRRMKLEEDNNRRLQHSRLQRHQIELDLNLERFLIITSYAFDGVPEASDAFWSDADGNLHGFLQWIARRQTTPRVAAFCEMFRSISQGQRCANAAHDFLLDEKPSISGKLKRKASISWSQILAEIQLYAANGKDKYVNRTGATQQPFTLAGEQVIESESSIMLQSYLRLLAHMSQESPIARQWLLRQPSGSIQELIFQLANSGVESRLQANCFLALAALLTNKDRALSEDMWNQLDHWLWGLNSSYMNLPRADNLYAGDPNIKNALFQSISMDFECSASFIGLLQALISPNADDPPINDFLPFPENLGATYRMPGIEEYVDFVVGNVFALKIQETPNDLKKILLRWNCLQFMATSLSSFNENLFLLASASQAPTDEAVEESRLMTYVRLHPFARVMEWLYNDRVVDALFAASHCTIEEVNDAGANSPLVASLVKCIEVINLVMALQPVYVDIVKPFLKDHYPKSKLVAANLASTCFEDSVLNHLQIIVDLGLYCGTGHQDLTVLSLQLLEKLSSSRRLEFSAMGRVGKSSNQSRVISAVQQDGNSELIARSLSLEMKLDERDVEAGQDSPGTIIKISILKLLISSLASLSSRPTLAHLLLGFSCDSSALSVKDNSLFASGGSLFHAVVGLLFDSYHQEGHGFVHWISNMKQLCFDILQKLWRSPLTAEIVSNELRVNQFLPMLAQYQVTLDPTLILDESALFRAETLLNEASNGLRLHLLQRSAFFEYAALELRDAMKANSPALQSQILACLIGTADRSDPSQVQNTLVLNLFEFADLEVDSNELIVPDIRYLCSMDELEKFRVRHQAYPELYKIDAVDEFLSLRLKSLRGHEYFQDPSKEQELINEAEVVLLHTHAHNRLSLISDAFRSTLKTWVQLVSVVLETTERKAANGLSFMLQTIHAVVTKLEKANTRNVFVALELAGLVRNILQTFHVSNSHNNNDDRKTRAMNDRLMPVFRIALNGMTSPITGSDLREIYYQICCRYLRWLMNGTACTNQTRRQVLRCVKPYGEKLIEAFADDAITGQGACKISSLLLLDTLLHLEQRDQSTYILDNVIKLNFIPVLLDDIRNMPTELNEANINGKRMMLDMGCQANLSKIFRCCYHITIRHCHFCFGPLRAETARLMSLVLDFFKLCVIHEYFRQILILVLVGHISNITFVQIIAPFDRYSH